MLSDKKIKEMAEKSYSVYHFCSVDAAQLDHCAHKMLEYLGSGDTEVTQIDGPVPSVEEIVLAAGTISFFSTRRIIYLPLMKPGSYSEKDFKDLCDILSSLENSVVIITNLIAEDWGKPRMNKTEQKLTDLCGKIGISEMLAKPTERELQQQIGLWAKEVDTQIRPDAAALLLEICGQDAFLLENEVAKLAAAAGYGDITVETVKQLGTRSLDADVFDLVTLINNGKTVQALQKLDILLRLQNEPVAIAAALSGSYLDLYRVSCAQAAHKNMASLGKDFGYRSTYRLEKGLPIVRRFGKKRLLSCLRILEQLDTDLKTSAGGGPKIALQTAICSLAGTR